jgi:hypothetical protein
MPLQILELGKQFRPSTSVVYPPFKKGRYMEEYFYEYIVAHKDKIESHRVYIPVFWTNLQIHPAFDTQKHNYQALLSIALSKMPTGTKYFTIVQHDDGIKFKLEGDVLVFGACTGNIPLPLIYEDTNETLVGRRAESNTEMNEKKYLASFIGSQTHTLRRKMKESLVNKTDIILGVQEKWSAAVPQTQAEKFIEVTLNSKFCLAPRGYGRSSFRFFEAILLNTIPVYFWDDKEWLPYKELLDYSKFAVSIHENDIPKTYEILQSISDENYTNMLIELNRVKRYFTLEGMSEYILAKIQTEVGALNSRCS